jgi:CheY-like chemotaxis protein
MTVRPILPLVLVVENDAVQRDFFTSALQGLCVIVTAANFREAVHKILTIPELSAVVTDYDLPDGAGFLVRKLAHLRELPVLVISGDASFGYDYQPFLAKPFIGGDFLDAVQQAICDYASSLACDAVSRNNRRAFSAISPAKNSSGDTLSASAMARISVSNR